MGKKISAPVFLKNRKTVKHEKGPEVEKMGRRRRQKGGFLGSLGLGLGALFLQIGGGGRKRKRKQKGGNLSRFLSKKDKQRFRRRRAFEDKYLPDLLQKGAGFGRRKQKGGFFSMLALPPLAAYHIGKTLRQSGV